MSLFNHTVNLTPKHCITVYSFYCKAQQRLKEICVVKQWPREQPQKSHEQDILQNQLKIDRSIFASYADACHELFCVFEVFYASGAQDAEVIKSLSMYGCVRLENQDFDFQNLNLDFPIEREIRKQISPPRNPSSVWISIKKSKSGFFGFPFLSFDWEIRKRI